MTERYALVLDGTTIVELQEGDSLYGVDKTTVGLGSVDNTADAAKPVSTAQQTALNLKANLISPTLVTPALGTPASGTLTNCTGLPQAGLAANVAGNGPAFRATQTGQSVTSAWVKLTGWTEVFDIGSYFDSVTNSRYQPQVAGYYFITGWMQLLGTTTATYINVYKNGSVYASGVYLPVSMLNPAVNIVTLIYLNGSTDYVELYGYSLTTLNTANAAFSGCLVRSG
jgi:hypothetical protein